MSLASASGRLTAVLGPTNTGKTHLAVERMLGHESGMIGFPLRLLAREIYDRIVKIKGAGQVALITGEEKIVPPGARYFVCTVEAMPLDREVAFLAVDEIQLGGRSRARPRLHRPPAARARHRTRPCCWAPTPSARCCNRLLPDAEVVARPRFSKLSYVGPKKRRACRRARRWSPSRPTRSMPSPS